MIPEQLKNLCDFVQFWSIILLSYEYVSMDTQQNRMWQTNRISDHRQQIFLKIMESNSTFVHILKIFVDICAYMHICEDICAYYVDICAYL